MSHGCEEPGRVRSGLQPDIEEPLFFDLLNRDILKNE